MVRHNPMLQYNSNAFLHASNIIIAFFYLTSFLSFILPLCFSFIELIASSSPRLPMPHLPPSITWLGHLTDLKPFTLTYHRRDLHIL